MLRPAVLLTATLLLAGCMPPEPIVTAPPEPEVTPIFASEEEALAAATEAYAKYLEVADQILADGGNDPERILSVATPEWAAAQYDDYARARAEKLHSTGATTFDSVALQNYDRGAVSGVAIVRIYACIDVSAVDVFDENGKSLVIDTRPNRAPFEVEFEESKPPPKRLLVADEVPWGGQDFCS